ncbi:oxidoreductase [Chlorobiota bacterium]|nr:oxidoreductase [Chlorobiota bacterium]
MRTLILTGATGLVGEEFINLFSMHRNAKLIIVARKHPDFTIPKGVEIRIVSDFFDRLHLRAALQDGQEMICCIGTTIAKAGSKEVFEKTDVGIVRELAHVCSELNFAGFHYVSSMQASIDSSAFYLQCKGRAEAEIQFHPFKRISILRPSLLLGNRREFRFGEKIGMMLSKLFPFLLIGPLKAIRPIKAETVAKCLLYRAMSDNEDTLILESEDIKTFTTLSINF